MCSSCIRVYRQNKDPKSYEVNSYIVAVQEELGEIARHDVAIETTLTLERQQEKKVNNILMEEQERRPVNILEEQKEGREMDILDKQEKQGRRESGVCLEFEEFEPDDYNERRQIAQAKEWKEGKKERSGRREERRQTQQVQVQQIQRKLQGEETEKEVIYSKPRKEERVKAEQPVAREEDPVNRKETNTQQKQPTFKKEEKRQKSPSKKEDKHSSSKKEGKIPSPKKEEKKKVSKKEEKPSEGTGLVELIGVKGLVGRGWPPPAQPSEEKEETVERWVPIPVGKLKTREDKVLQKPAALKKEEQHPEVVNRKEVVSSVKTPHHSYQNGISTSKEVGQETDIVPSKNSQNATGNKPGKDRDR